MKSKTVIALMVSVGCGIVAAVGIMRAIGNEAEVEVEQTLPVLMANDFLDIKSPLTSENCHVEYWPAKLVPNDAVADLEEVQGMFNKMRLSKGLPIMASQIADQSFFDQDMIPPGHKVVAVKVNEDDTISGLLKPGQQVDIIGIVDAPVGENGNARQKVANTFLKGIRVYSIDGARDGSLEASQPGRRGNAVVGILVTETQSEQIVLVQRVGALKLVLRGSNSENSSDDQPSFVDLFPDLAKPGTRVASKPKVEIEVAKQKAPSFVMTVYNGNEQVNHKFDEQGNLVNEEESESGFASLRSPSPATANGPGKGPGPVNFDGSEGYLEGFEEDQYLGE